MLLNPLMDTQWIFLGSLFCLGGVIQALILTRFQGEFKDSLSERFNKNFLDTHEHLERILSLSRHEFQQGLQHTTQALETKFQSF